MNASRHHYFFFFCYYCYKILLLPLLVFLFASACSHARPANLPRLLPSDGRVPMWLSLLEEHRYLALSQLCLYRHFKAIKGIEEDFLRGEHGTFALSRGRLVIAQHQAPSLSNPMGDGSPMTALEPGSDFHRAQCACLLLQGEAKSLSISIYPQPPVNTPSFGAF